MRRGPQLRIQLVVRLAIVCQQAVIFELHVRLVKEHAGHIERAAYREQAEEEPLDRSQQ